MIADLLSHCWSCYSQCEKRSTVWAPHLGVSSRVSKKSFRPRLRRTLNRLFHDSQKHLS